MNLNIKKFNKFFLVYIIFLIVCSIFFLSKTYLSQTNNSMAEWAINYSGGFGRRGFFGEIFTFLSLLLDQPYRRVILLFLFVVFILYYLIIYFFIAAIKLNNWIIFAILSPLFLIFPIAELEALGRKDILIPLFFLLYLHLTEKFSFYTNIIILVLIYSILLLTHEVSIFYLPFFYAIILLKYENFHLDKIIILLIISFLFLAIIYLLSNSIHTEDKFNLMCTNLKEKLNEECGLGAYMLKRTLSDNFSEMKGFNVNHILHNFIIFVLGYLFLISLLIHSRFQKKNVLSKMFNFKILSLILFIPTTIPFVIAVDWGRWYNLSYTMLIIFFLFNFKKGNIIFEESKYLNKISSLIFSSKKIFLISLIIFCFTWNPKAVYHEDIGSIPVYRAILKIYKYF